MGVQGELGTTFSSVYVCYLLSCIQLFATPWTIACQAPLSTEFSRQEYWSGLLFPSPRDLPGPGIKPRYLALQACSLPSEPPRKPHVHIYIIPPQINYYYYYQIKTHFTIGTAISWLRTLGRDCKSHKSSEKMKITME